MKEQKKILDIKGVSEYTTLSVATIYKKVCLGEIPYHKIGSRTLFVQDEIDDWIRNDGRVVERLPELKLI